MYESRGGIYLAAHLPPSRLRVQGVELPFFSSLSLLLLFSLSSCIHLLRAISNESNEAHVLSSLFLSSLFPFFQRSVSGLLFGGPFNRDLETRGEYGKNPGEVRMKERGGRPS